MITCDFGAGFVELSLVRKIELNDYVREMHNYVREIPGTTEAT